MNEQNQNSPEPQCKNCQHPIALHKPDRSFRDDENEDKTRGCENPEHYNSLGSGDYKGWSEIHCNSCGTLLGFTDSRLENIFDYTILCNRWIKKLYLLIITRAKSAYTIITYFILKSIPSSIFKKNLNRITIHNCYYIHRHVASSFFYPHIITAPVRGTRLKGHFVVR